MCDILKSNFEEKLPEIEEALKNATFIAFDTEFSGLFVYKNCKPSLFDTASQRYDKLRKNIEKVIILQIGLSAFKFVRDENKYVVRTYRLPVFPCAFGSLDTVYLTQASATNFLCEYDFDFNKVMYEGIPFLNTEEEKKLRQELKHWRNIIDVRNMNFLEEEMLRYLKIDIEKVAEWEPLATCGDRLLLSDFQKLKSRKHLAYALHIEIRQRFNNVWTFNDEKGIIVVKIKTEKHTLLITNSKLREELDEDLIKSLCGFSHVFKLLVQLQKPMVGHNCLSDILLMYQQFHKALPRNYKSFKKEINSLFPSIYDTKHISYEVKHLLERDALPSTVLIDLYDFFERGKGSILGVYSPKIVLENVTDEISDETKGIHDAAWDAYYSGYCFIRMAHVIANRKLEIKVGRPLTSIEHFTALNSLKNNINLIRCSIPHLCFSGPDPHSSRPPWIHIETRTKRSLSIDEVYSLLSQFDAVDVAQYSRNSALVAVGTKKSARMIRKKLKNNEEFKVSDYSLIRHNNVLRNVLWICAASTSITSIWFIMKHVIHIRQ